MMSTRAFIALALLLVGCTGNDCTLSQYGQLCTTCDPTMICDGSHWKPYTPIQPGSWR